jgi:putative ABC transport system substrate-binding protein
LWSDAGSHTLLGGASAWPLAARAQQQLKLPIIGSLDASTPAIRSEVMIAFLQRLRELGWIEGRTVAIEYRWAEGRNERLAEIARDLVRLKVDVIVTSGNEAVKAAKEATSLIPIVFSTAGDPIGTGLVASLARPGGNVTGLSLQQRDLAGKRVELLRELLPGLRRLAIMANIANPGAVPEMDEVQAAARGLGLDVARLEIRRADDIAPAFESLKDNVEALYVVGDPLMLTNRVRISIWAVAARLPTIHNNASLVESGGLISYGPSIPAMYRRTAELVDKVLRGTRPADIPVEQPTNFDLVVNLTTAKVLGLTVPPKLLALTTEVIE